MTRSSSLASESGTCRRRLRGWLEERIGLDAIVAFARHKTVPVHAHSFWYYWGGLSLFLFGVQAVTGVLLLVYFRPGPESFESVRLITYDIEFGWLIRSAHSWSANFMILAVFVHMFSVFFMRAYRGPRELTWWSGLALLGLTFVFGFSGYLLPMDELAFFATKVGLEITHTIPVVGAAIADLIRGGPEVSEATVQRFFALHVVVLPAILVPLLGFHLWMVGRHGNAVPASEAAKPPSERRTIPFFPNFLVKDLALWLIALNVIAILASLFPWQLGAPANPVGATPLGIHPEWYFMSQFQLLKVLGRWFPGITGEIVGLAVFSLAMVLWALVPLFDPRTASGRRARATTWVGILTLVGFLLFTLWGYWEVRA